MVGGCGCRPAPADQHVGTVGREHEFGQRADKARARLDQRHQRARGDVDALEHPLPVLPDLVDQPVRLVGFQKCVAGQHVGALAMRLEDQHGDLKLVDAQMQDGVVEFARHLQRPERRALRDHAVDIGGRRRLGRLDRNGGDARRAVDIDADQAIADAVVVEAARQRRQRDALAAAVARRGGGEFLGALGDPGLELAVRHDLVDQAPCDRALALDAFLDGAEVIGVVAADLALVDHARQSAGARQHRKQRHFRQCHRGRAVIGEDDVIGGQARVRNRRRPRCR